MLLDLKQDMEVCLCSPSGRRLLFAEGQNMLFEDYGTDDPIRGSFFSQLPMTNDRERLYSLYRGLYTGNTSKPLPADYNYFKGGGYEI